MLAIALALGSSLVYGVSDFLGGLKTRKLALLPVLVVSQGTALVVLALIVLPLGHAPPDGRFVLYAALAGLAEVVGVAALYRGLAVGLMSIVAPVTATAPVVGVLVSLGLGEIPAPIQAAGIALAVGGVALTSCREVDGGSTTVASSVLIGIVAALGFGAYLVGMDAASEGDVGWALLVARLVVVSVLAAIVLARRPSLAMRRADLATVGLIGVLIVGADSTFAIASTKGLLSVVAVLSSLYPVVTIALARIVLREHVEPIQQLGIATTFCGVVAISIA